MQSDNIVIFRLGSLGDTIVSLPCWQAILATFPDAHRTLLTNMSVSAKAAGVPAVLGDAGFIDDYIEYPIGLRSIEPVWTLFRRLRATRAKTLIYLAEPRGALSVYRDWLFFRLCGFTRIIGAPLRADIRENRCDPLTGLLEQECLRLARQMAELGVPDLAAPSSWDLRLKPGEIAAGEGTVATLAHRPFLAINMGGKDIEKDWGEANWAALMAQLGSALPGIGLLTVGAPSDSPRALALQAGWPGPSVDACGKLSVRECAAALAKASLFIGHDSGPLHLAASRSVPCIGLFGDFNAPNKWHPYGERHLIIHRMSGMSAIGIEEVYEAATTLWKRAVGGTAATT